MHKIMRGKWLVRGIFYFIAVAFTLSVSSCGGGGGGGGGANGAKNVIIPATTKAVDETTIKKLTSISPDGATLTFSETTPQLQTISAGDVIVLGPNDVTPDGLLRKVSSVSQSEGQVIIITTAATLEEAIQQGSVTVAKTLSASDVRSAVALQKGVSLAKGVRNQASPGLYYYVEISDVVLYDEDGDLNTTDDQITAAGSISLNNPAFTFNMTIDNSQIKQLTFTNTITEAATVKINCNSVSGSLRDLLDYLQDQGRLPDRVILSDNGGKVELARYTFSPITAWVGYVPIVISPVLTLNVGLDGEVSVDITSSVTQEATLTAGISYNNGNWSPVSELTKTFSFAPPALSASAAIKAYAGPQLNLLLYGVAGPYAEIKGYLELDAAVLATPWWELYGGLDADLGVRVEVLGHNMADYDLPGVIDYRILLAQAETLPNQSGMVSGSVKNAVVNLPLDGVTVKIFQQASEITTGTTNSSGTFSLSVPAGNGYRIEFSKTGYIAVNYYDITIDANTTKYLEAVLQIDTAHSGAGNIGGQIVNALNGIGVSGLTVNLRTGINVTTGSIVATTTTDSSGAYSLSSLAAGNYTAQVSASGYNTAYFTVICIGGTTTANQNSTVTPILSAGETRIILTWGSTPSDLDSHLTGPLSDGTRFHMYFPYAEANGGSAWPEYVKLDLDDVTSYGPETTTIYQQISGVYRFSVHDYSNLGSSSSTALSASSAQVRVYRASNLIATFNVPSNQGGTLWTVFEMSGDTITPINAMSYESSSMNIQKPSLLKSIQTDANLMVNLPQKRH